MLVVVKVLLGLFALLLLYLSYNWMILTAKIAKEHDIQPTSSTGYNYLSGDIGGILLGSSIMMGLYLYQGGEQWIYPILILMGAVILGRVISLLMHGNSKQGIIGIVVELIIGGLILGIHYLS